MDPRFKKQQERKKQITSIMRSVAGKIDSQNLLDRLPGRGRLNVPPVPKKYYEYEWCVFATDPILKSSLANYINEKQSGEYQQIYYKGKSLDVYGIPAEGVDRFKEKLKEMGIKSMRENFILHKKRNPKTSQWTLWSWK
jgi:hypothetical protein